MIVVGSGPAGLTAAYLLSKRGEKVIVVDKAKVPGGLWRGFDYTVRVPQPMAVPYGTAPVSEEIACKVEKLHFETGMHWYTDCGVPDIDAFWRCLPVERVEIPREIAGCVWDGRLQTNSPYPDVRGGKEFHNRPVLEKLWGVPMEELSENADRLIKINRAVVADEAETLAAYRADPRNRDIMAWPDQRTLPEEYRSGVASFYPVDGMGALVDAAVDLLQKMGVKFWLGIRPPFFDDKVKTVWAAGMHGFAATAGLEWPSGMTPPRALTLINVLLPDEIPPHDLHYAFDYTESRMFRQTWYRNFDPNGPNRMSIEILGGDDVETARANRGMVVGKHFLGPVLPVPTQRNEEILEHMRHKAAAFVPHVKLIGAGAKAGLFYQPEILRHVAETCDGPPSNTTFYHPV